MRTMALLENLEFHDRDAYAQPLMVDKDGRAFRFMLRPGQSIREHNAPSSPMYLVVLKGHGQFAGEDGQEQAFGPGELLIFDRGEGHSIRAVDELVFAGFLREAPDSHRDRVGGQLGREPKTPQEETIG